MIRRQILLYTKSSKWRLCLVEIYIKHVSENFAIAYERTIISPTFGETCLCSLQQVQIDEFFSALSQGYIGFNNIITTTGHIDFKAVTAAHMLTLWWKVRHAICRYIESQLHVNKPNIMMFGSSPFTIHGNIRLGLFQHEKMSLCITETAHREVLYRFEECQPGSLWRLSINLRLAEWCIKWIIGMTDDTNCNILSVAQWVCGSTSRQGDNSYKVNQLCKWRMMTHVVQIAKPSSMKWYIRRSLTKVWLKWWHNRTVYAHASRLRNVRNRHRRKNKLALSNAFGLFVRFTCFKPLFVTCHLLWGKLLIKGQLRNGNVPTWFGHGGQVNYVKFF